MSLKSSRAASGAAFEIPSDINYIRKTSKKIARSLTPLGVDESTLFDIRLCVEEALRNAMVHGNRSKKSLTVKVSYHIDKNRFEAVVEDQGSGFDPGKVPDPTIEENMLKYGGRGVYLIRRLMDEVEYNDRGNRVKMVKYI